MKKVSVGMYVEEVEESEHFKVPCDAMIFTEGDFVDVCIGFDIVSKRGRDGWMNVQVHLNIEHILLLVAGPDVGIVRLFIYPLAPSQNSAQEEDDDGEFAVQAPGLVF
jgi:hypothetical protein